jgi:hypothetical protein
MKCYFCTANDIDMVCENCRSIISLFVKNKNGIFNSVCNRKQLPVEPLYSVDFAVWLIQLQVSVGYIIYYINIKMH